jgi:hypothetical protein
MPNNLIARHGADLSPTLLVTAAALAAAPSPLALGRVSDRVDVQLPSGSGAALVGLAVPASVIATRRSLGLVLAQLLIGICSRWRSVGRDAG